MGNLNLWCTFSLSSIVTSPLLFLGETPSPSATLLLGREQLAIIQIEPIYAIVILFAVVLFGILIGIWTGWFLTGRDLQRAKAENQRLHATLRASQHERDLAQRELEGKQRELALFETQQASLQRQQEQTHSYAQTLEKQVADLSQNLINLAVQNEDLNHRFLTRERFVYEQQATINAISALIADKSQASPKQILDAVMAYIQASHAQPVANGSVNANTSNTNGITAHG